VHRIGVLALAAAVCACSVAPSASASQTAAIPSASPTVTPTPAASTAAPTPSRTPIPLPNTAQIDAPSGSVVWAIVGDQAAGARIFRSTDRGDSWQEASMPPALPVDVSFVDDREGWALVPQGQGVPPPVGGACTAPTVSLQHTSDRGATWQQLAPTGLTPGPCKSSVRFADAQRGFISAFDPNGSPLVYRTADGGRTWTASRPLPDPPGFTTRPGSPTLGVGRVAAFGTTLLVTAFPTGPATGTLYAYRSTDGGATWTYASTAPNPLTDLAFVTATRWLQISSPGDSKETTDGGASWHAFTTDYAQAAPVAPSVSFGDAQVGYATVRGAIQRTVDGGAHWTGIRTPGTF
jgi:photosystem II stability/assembly factor-like uncharacterized protein